MNPKLTSGARAYIKSMERAARPFYKRNLFLFHCELCLEHEGE